MAGGDTDDRPCRSYASKARPSSRSKRALKHDEPADEAITTPKPPSLDELRKSRVAYFSVPEAERRRTMKYVYDQSLSKRVVVKANEPEGRRSSTSRRTSRAGEKDKHKRRHREDEEDGEKVYVTRPVSRRTSSISESKPIKESKSGTSAILSSRRTSTVERKAPQRRHTAPSVPATRDLVALQERRQSKDEVPHSSTMKVDARPSLKRSATTAAARTEVSLAKSTATARTPKKASSVFSSFFQAAPPSPEKKVSCLTCGDDEIPVSKSARLPCKHRMCHSCLRRVFKMSITDPAHMPPRCCTDDHIDLKHVDKLFSQEFKKTWNRKFLEYKTKNRIYCIGRNCGDWIKPSHITVEHGRKIGKCKRCGTKVCAICNNKAHSSRDCPKDPATKQFIDTAKQKGWQKCFNCSAMVELKEGCNHMTCRCMAEFCMVCGLKWKSCDCPWFNYEAADAHLGNPQRYQEEMDRRRDQEHRDEALAARMEVLGIDADQVEGGIFGLGNAAGHHMNANFIQQAREALTANYQTAEQAARGLLNGWYMGRENRMPGIPEDLANLPQLLRQQSMRQTGEDGLEDDAVGPGRRRRHRRRATQLETGGDAAEPANGRRQATEQEQDQDRRIREWATGVEG